MSKEVGTPRYLSLVAPLEKVGDEAVHKELGDRIERAATTASSLEASHYSVVVPGAKIPYWGMWILKLGLRLHLNSPMIHLSQEVTHLEVEGQYETIGIDGTLSDLYLDDAESIDCLPTATICEELARIGVGKDYSGRITPLFDTMMVQASEEVGEDSDHLTDSTQIPTINQPSTSSQPKKKRTSKKTQRKE
ncbi:hypothetical protein Tco_0812464 [Tanacetum coccineum]